jgi:hypothetical protein
MFNERGGESLPVQSREAGSYHVAHMITRAKRRPIPQNLQRSLYGAGYAIEEGEEEDEISDEDDVRERDLPVEAPDDVEIPVLESDSGSETMGDEDEESHLNWIVGSDEADAQVDRDAEVEWDELVMERNVQ